MNPAQRKLRAQIAAHTRHSKCDPVEATAPARAAFLSKFEHEVDPDGVLQPEERARRAQHLLKAHFKRLAHKSAQARRRGGDAA